MQEVQATLLDAITKHETGKPYERSAYHDQQLAQIASEKLQLALQQLSSLQPGQENHPD